jgi:hypothetical protein
VELAPQLAYRGGGVEQCFSCMGPEGDDNLRLDYLNLSLEEGQAACDFVGLGIAIARRATFQYVAYEDVASLEAAGDDDFVQQLAGPAHEGASLGVFIGAGGFSGEHYARVGVALAGHCVGPRRAQTALAAFADFFGDFFKFSGFVGNSHLVLLILSLRFLALESKTGKKLLHLQVLANDFAYVYIVFHRHEL